MKATLWGTRGSIATPGPETVRYGGNTSCVELRGHDGTLLILDAGTGIRRLGAQIDPDIRRVDLLLTHLHMDHIQGLGFFEPLFRPGLDVQIWGPPSTTLDLRTRLGRYLSPPLFPVRLRDLPCDITLHSVTHSRFWIGDFDVRADLVCHPGPTLGFRIQEGSRSLAYIPDHEPALGLPQVPDDPRWLSGHELAEGTDLLIHDAQFTSDEYPKYVGYGHSALPHTLAFARSAGARRLVAFHHDPSHTDPMLDDLYAKARRDDLPFELIAATEGSCFDLGP